MLQIFRNVFIIILCVSDCDVINFEVFLSNRFPIVKRLSDEIGNVHHFYRVLIEVKKTDYFWMGAIQKVRTL